MDIERTMEFLLDQQAKLSVRMDEVQQSQLKLHEFIEKVISMMERVMATMEGVAHVQEGYNKLLYGLCEAERKTEEHVGKLADAQEKTLDQLHAFLEEQLRRLQVIPPEPEPEQQPET
jgi:DNA repair ATPase RecN